MAVLHLAFEEGFAGDEVSVTVDGERVFHAESLTTRMQIGLATTAEYEVSAGKHSLGVSCRGVTDTFDVDVVDTVYVGISLTRSGAIEHRISNAPFGYV
jgi:hypothetical protein